MHRNKIFQLAGGSTWCGLLTIDDYTGGLYKEEYQLINGCAEKRRKDFSTARVLARAVLAKLGIDSCSIMPGENGAPVWPAGITGSISHSGDLCFVAVSALGGIAIGIDVQQLTPIDAQLTSLILTKEEQATNPMLPGANSNTMANIIFSAKESVYKCLPPGIPPDLDFRDAVITPGRRLFTAHVARMNLTIEGIYVVSGGYVFTGAARSTIAQKSPQIPQ